MMEASTQISPEDTTANPLDWLAPPVQTSIYQRTSYIMVWYVNSGILVSGIITNLLSFITMLQPGMRQQTTSVYLTCLALTDIASLVFLAVRFWYYVEPYCHLNGYFIAGFTTWSCLLVVAVTTERLIAVWFPLKASIWLSRKRANILSVGLLILSFAMFLPRPFSSMEQAHCLPGGIYKDVYFIQVMLLYSCLPIIVLVVLNTAIIIRLNMRTSLLQQDQANQAKVQEVSRITKMVVVISVTYIFLTLPSVGTLIYRKITGDPIFTNRDMDFLGLILVYQAVMVNHSINFWLYVLVSAKFRGVITQVLYKVCFRKTASNAASSATLSSVMKSVASSSAEPEKNIL